MIQRRNRAAALMLAAALTPAPALAPALAGEERPEGALEERVETALYLIDVVVTDRAGRPAPGLGPDDFDVRVAGEPRKALAADRGGERPAGDAGADPAGAVGPAETAAKTEAKRRTPGAEAGTDWIVLYFDADRIPPLYRMSALESARGLVERHAGPGARVAVVVARGGEASFLVPFAPAAAFDVGPLGDPGILYAPATELRTRLVDLVDGVEACARRRGARDACMRQASAEFLHAAETEVDAGLRALRATVDAIAALPGRKALVWYGEGLLLRPGDVVLEALRAIDPETWERSLNRLQGADRPDYDALLAAATDARVSLFALRTGRDPAAEAIAAERGGGGGGGLETAAALSPYRAAGRMLERSLRDAAEATGGTVVLAPLDAGTGDGLLDRLGAVYTLAIPVHRGDGPDPKIRVRARDRSLETASMTRRARPQAPPAAVRGVVTATVAGPAPAREVDVRLTLESDSLGQEPAAPGQRVALFARLIDAEGAALDRRFEIVAFPRASDAAVPLLHALRLETAGREPAEVELVVRDLAGDARRSFRVPVQPAR